MLRFLDHTQLDTHINTVGLLLTSDRLVPEAATYTTHNRHRRQTSMSSAGFEPTMRAKEWQQIYSLDRSATGIYKYKIILVK